MTLQTILETNKEKLISAVHSADTASAIRVMNTELDRMLYTFNDQEENDRVRAAASNMIQIAKAACSLIDSTGETKIYGRTEYGRTPPDKGRMSKWGLLSLFLGLIGVAFMAVCMYLLVRSATAGDMDLQSVGLPPRLLLVGVPLLTVVAFFVAGLLLRYRKKPSKETLYTETKMDGTKVYSHLLSLILVIDKCLEDIRTSARQEEKERLQEQVSTMDSAELDLLSQLLEDAYGRKGEDDLAEEEISQIRFFLHKKGIEVIDWNADTARKSKDQESETASQRGWFDMMPAYKSGTIRPALVADGKLLRKGMASARKG